MINFFSMKEKSNTKTSKLDANKDSIGIFTAIDKEQTSFFEKPDNSWWWTYAIFLLCAGFTAIWAINTF